MITGKINLTALEHKKVTSKEGTECLVIPIKNNNLFFSEKTKTVYMDFILKPIPEEKRKGDDHYFVSQSVSTEIYKKMKEDGKYPPSLGYARDWERQETNNETQDNIDVGADDLPF